MKTVRSGQFTAAELKQKVKTFNDKVQSSEVPKDKALVTEGLELKQTIQTERERDQVNLDAAGKQQQQLTWKDHRPFSNVASEIAASKKAAGTDVSENPSGWDVSGSLETLFKTTTDIEAAIEMVRASPEKPDRWKYAEIVNKLTPGFTTEKLDQVVALLRDPASHAKQEALDSHVHGLSNLGHVFCRIPRDVKFPGDTGLVVTQATKSSSSDPVMTFGGTTTRDATLEFKLANVALSVKIPSGTDAVHAGELVARAINDVRSKVLESGRQAELPHPYPTLATRGSASSQQGAIYDSQ